ncbi:hypothetical protein [Parerythrobacter lacustris]|uniref:Phage baseplate protein n=1 Tax=Parerythrobacter lacustris TaxID=2969984 RepID=A0ABT1XUF8_9SPHN|nr:hypothetical protein [Parerythrobacter lacustris]MCR2835283.1 hypothetical protein [Parerythrobacter lacustris]
MLRLGDVARRSSAAEWAVQAVLAGWPGLARTQVEAWPLGQLDNALVALRRTHFGDEWACEPQCTACGETFDLEFDPGTMGFGIPSDWEPGALPTRAIEFSGDAAIIRPLIVHDLIAIERCAQEGDAAAYLAAALEVAEENLSAALELSAELDPLSNIWLATQCPECSAEQALLFDPARFLAEEVARHADRLLGEVADIAQAYHWSEADILAMPAARRRFYLTRIAS